MGSIRSRSDGSFEIRWKVNVDGRWERRSKTVRTTRKKDAQKILDEIELEIYKGTYIEPKKTKIKDFLNKWLEVEHEKNTTEETFKRNKGHIEKHILPALGNIELQKLQPLKIQEFYTKLLTSGKSENEGLKPASVIKIHKILNSALKCAYRWKMISWNPMEGVSPPKDTQSQEENKLTENQIAEVLDKLKNDNIYNKIYLAVLISLTTGLRQGEICGLKWSDLEGNILYVRRAITQSTKRQKSPKTGQRAVPVPEVLAEELKAEWKRQARERLEKPEYNGENYIVVVNGKMADPDYIKSAWGRFKKKAGLNVTFHGLRHTHASLLVDANVNIRKVQKQLGHAKIQTTQRYTHPDAEMLEEIADTIDAIFNKKADSK